LITTPITITTKLINDKSSYPYIYNSFTTYASYFVSTSNTFSLALPATLSTATLTEFSFPSIYNPIVYVNTFVQNYNLTINFPANSNQPIVYIDFQKGGIKPDQLMCTNTYFIQCRVYSKIRNILVAQFHASWTGGSTDLNFNSNYAYFLYLPKHQ